MDFNDIVSRFTSRKFIGAVASFVAASLVASGVVDTDAESELVDAVVTGAGFATTAIYIIVEGINDMKNR